jgi:GNAT superfamily N-acetyltransferase
MTVAIPVALDEVEAYAALLATAFTEERFTATLVEVLDSPIARRDFLLATSRSDIEAFARAGCAWGVPGAGLVLADIAGHFSKEDGERQWQATLEAGCVTLSAAERAAVVRRAEELEPVAGCDWRAIYPAGFGNIAAICVAPDRRGSGVFGALIDPLIEACKQRCLPLTLEAYAPNLVELYAHRGFEVVRTASIAVPPLTEWAMARLP